MVSTSVQTYVMRTIVTKRMIQMSIYALSSRVQ